MAASVVFAIEGVDHVEPVSGVDLEERQQHESDRSPFAGRPGLDAGPQISIHTSQRVIHLFGLHNFSSSCKDLGITSRCAVGDLDHHVHGSEVTAR